MHCIACVNRRWLPKNHTSCNTDSLIQQEPTILRSGLITFPESSARVQPGTTVGGIQMKCNKTQYLYRQLCHIDKELGLLGPSSFPTTHSYRLALQQVQAMRAFLEDQIFRSSRLTTDELTQKTYKMYSLKEKFWWM